MDKRYLYPIIILFVLQSFLCPMVLSEPQGEAAETGTSSSRADPDTWVDEFNDFSKVSVRGGGTVIDSGAVTLEEVANPYTADDSTIVLLHFDEGTGTTAADSGPNMLDGEFGEGMDETDWVAGISGNALDFDGIDNFVDLPESALYNLNNITIEAWTYPRHIEATSNTFVVWKRTGYMLMDSQFTIDTPSVVTARKKVVPENEWSYIVGSFDGSAVRFYHNGELIVSKSTNKSIFNSHTFMRIGAGAHSHDHSIESSYYHYDGIIDEIRVSNRARSALEINNTYLSFQNMGTGKLPPSSFVVSESITIPDGKYWKDLEIVKETPPDTSIKVTIYSNSTKYPLSGLEDINGTTIDLSMIDPKYHPTLKLKAILYSDDDKAPRLDEWKVTWRDSVPPVINDFTINDMAYPDVDTPFYVNTTDPDQGLDMLDVLVEARYSNGGEWSTDFIQDLHFQSSNDSWAGIFRPWSNPPIGPYSFRITVTDHVGLTTVRIFENMTIVYPEEGVDAYVELLDYGLYIYRGGRGTLGILPHTHRPNSDVVMEVFVLDKDDTPRPWVDSLTYNTNDDLWKFDVVPPTTADMGWHDIIINVSTAPGKYFEQRFTDAVHFLNNLPYWNHSRPLVGFEDQLDIFDLTPNVLDIDTPQAELSVEIEDRTNRSYIALSIDGMDLVITKMEDDWYGIVTLSLNISDGLGHVLVDVNLTIQEVNDLPIWDVIPLNDTVVEGVEYSTFARAIDVDVHDFLSYSLVEGPDGLVMDPADGEMSWIPEWTQFEPVEVTIRVSDGEVTLDHSYSLTVIPIIDVIINVPKKGETYSGKLDVVGGVDGPGNNTIYNVYVQVDHKERQLVPLNSEMGWKFELDTTKMENGRHHISVEAILGNTSSGSEVLFKVENEKGNTYLSSGWLLWALLALVIICIVAIILFHLRQGKRRREAETEDPGLDVEGGLGP